MSSAVVPLPLGAVEEKSLLRMQTRPSAPFMPASAGPQHPQSHQAGRSSTQVGGYFQLATPSRGAVAGDTKSAKAREEDSDNATSSPGSAAADGSDVRLMQLQQATAVGSQYHGLVIVGNAPMPFVESNVGGETTRNDLAMVINGNNATLPGSCCWGTVLGLATLGLYNCCKLTLIDSDEWGFVLDNGHTRILFPGWHSITSPFVSMITKVKQSVDQTQFGTATIVRVLDGQVAIASDGTKYEVLMPGLHVRNSPTFKFYGKFKQTDEVISVGPINMFLVPSGSVRACYTGGVLDVFEPGRYGIHSPVFTIGNLIPTQIQSLRFSKHSVLLSGGINLLVEGLLTYQVTNAKKLIMNLGETKLVEAITNGTKAELARVFAGIHLEDISSAGASSVIGTSASGIGGGGLVGRREAKGDAKEMALLSSNASVVSSAGAGEGETVVRLALCQQVIDDMQPNADKWGVSILNFQLESTTIADAKYARDYEEASLAMAKAKANLRASQAQNAIRVQQSTGAAEAQRIQSEGDKAAIVIRAQAEAESIKIQADAKQAAAQAMKSPFAQQQALLALQVAFAEKLKATTLLVASDSSIARQLQFPMYQTQAQADVIESQPTRKHHGRGGRTSSDAGVSAGAPADSAFEERKS